MKIAWPRGLQNNFFINHYESPNDRTEVRDIKGKLLFYAEFQYKDEKVINCSYQFGLNPGVNSKNIMDIRVDSYSRCVIMKSKDNHYSLYDLKGNKILPPIYNDIQPAGDIDEHLLLKDDKISIMNCPFRKRQ